MRGVETDIQFVGWAHCRRARSHGGIEMSRLGRLKATLALGLVLASASILASAVPALGYYWGTNQTTTKLMNVNGATITSKVVWRAGNNGGTGPAVVIHVVS